MTRLLILLDERSRHDTSFLLSGYAGQWFWKILAPDYTRFNTEVVELAKFTGLPDDIKVVLLLGEKSLQHFKPGASLNSWRGSPFQIGDKTFIASYAPQDAYDRKSYFKEDNEKKADGGDEKNHQKTKRNHWRFWLYQDCKKVLRICHFGLKLDYNWNRIIYPQASQFVNFLKEQNGQNLGFDIETDPRRNITCFTVGVYKENIYTTYTIPVKNYEEKLAYSNEDMLQIFRALGVAFLKNTIIGHNLAFDLFICTWRYKLPLPIDLRDTMLIQHRIYPEVEKSLGHCISLYTDLPFHKDEAIFEPKTAAQDSQLWTYNAKDVFTTLIIYDKLIARAQQLLAFRSALQACESLRAYIIMSLTGAKLNIEARDKLYNKQQRMYNQCLRILKILTKREINPRSSQQVSNYYYNVLGYEKPEKDPTNELVLLKLYLKTNCPSLRVILKAREVGKSASGLQFALWKSNRMTCSWNIAGTETFRLGSRALLSNKSKGIHQSLRPGWGTNFQNWNKKQRHLIEADNE